MRPPPPTTLDECDRLLDAWSAEVQEAQHHLDDGRRCIPRVRSLVAMHRAAHALPSDALIEELTRTRAAVTYAVNWTDNDVVIRARLRRLLLPTWWERVVDAVWGRG